MYSHDYKLFLFSDQKDYAAVPSSGDIDLVKIVTV